MNIDPRWRVGLCRRKNTPWTGYVIAVAAIAAVGLGLHLRQDGRPSGSQALLAPVPHAVRNSPTIARTSRATPEARRLYLCNEPNGQTTIQDKPCSGTVQTTVAVRPPYTRATPAGAHAYMEPYESKMHRATCERYKAAKETYNTARNRAGDNDFLRQQANRALIHYQNRYAMECATWTPTYEIRSMPPSMAGIVQQELPRNVVRIGAEAARQMPETLEIMADELYKQTSRSQP